MLFFAMDIGISAGLASVVIQSQAFFTAGLSFVLLAERIFRRRMAGILIAFVGIGIIGSLHDTSTTNGGGHCPDRRAELGGSQSC